MQNALGPIISEHWKFKNVHIIIVFLFCGAVSSVGFPWPCKPISMNVFCWLGKTHSLMSFTLTPSI